MIDTVQAPSDETFKLFQTLIKLHTGIFLPAHKKTLLHNRLAKRLLARQMSSFDEYYQLLTSTSEQEELKIALELITTNETYFFREPKHFELLKDIIKNQSRSGSALRIWSAASSSGEEPYSIAMVLQECCNRPWKILASDVNDSVVRQAKKGIYLDQRTSGIPTDYLTKYCRKGVDEYDGYLRIVPDLRRLVDFQVVNLMEPFLDVGEFDIIFLRNVMIYFEKSTQAELLKRIAKRMKSNGWLIVSHSESLHGVGEDYYTVTPSVYRLAEYKHEH